MPPRLITLADLDTRDLLGVEILAPGTWNADPYTQSHLASMQSAYYELKGKLTPPGKLGHDDGQALAQRDGYPAMGWVSKLYTVGGKLLADFTKVPGKVAALIKAGAYDRVSCEVLFDYEVDGKTYPRVLKAVSFLGGDMPAVRDIKSIADVSALYTDLPKAEAHLADMPWDKEKSKGEDDEEEYTAKMIASLEASLGQFEATGDDAEKPSRKRINGALSKMRAELAGLKRPPFAPLTEEHDMDTKKLAVALGLPETATEAEIFAALPAKKADPEPDSKLAADPNYRALNDRVGALTRELAENKATAAVQEATLAGKLAPAQREWAKKYAIDDPDGFKAYVTATPKIAILSGPIGHSLDTEADGTKPTEEAKKLSADLGVSTASLERAASGVPTHVLAREARAKRAS